MRTLTECEEYFKNIYTTWLIYQDDESLQKLENLKTTLDFIYPDFRNKVTRWINEASKEYYKSLKTA